MFAGDGGGAGAEALEGDESGGVPAVGALLQQLERLTQQLKARTEELALAEERANLYKGRYLELQARMQLLRAAQARR